jgi:hypothetical protein
MNSREEIRKFMSIEQSMVQKAKRYDSDVNYLLDQLWRDEHTHAECEARMTSDSMQAHLARGILDLVIADYPEVFTQYKEIEKFSKDTSDRIITSEASNDKDGVLLANILKLAAEFYMSPAAC